MKAILHTIFSTVFNITLPLFMVMGLVIVVVQMVAAVMGDGQTVLAAGKSEIYAIWVSVICGFAGYLDHYVRPKKKKA